MPVARITFPDGRTARVTVPEGTTDEQAYAAAQAEYDKTKDPYLRNVPLPPDQPQPEKVTGQPKDFLRAGKLLVGAESPKDFGDYATMAAGTAPLMLAGGLGAGALASKAPSLVRAAAPAIGEMITAAGLGGTQAAVQGKGAGGIGLNALLDATVAGLTRGATSVASGGVKLGPVKLGLKEWGGPARGFEWATKAPGEALDLIASRMPKGKYFNVPAISSKPMTAREAVEGLSKLEGADYDLAKSQITSEIGRLDMGSMVNTRGQIVKIPGDKAARTFIENTAEHRFPPSTLSQGAEATRKALVSPFTRAGLESMMLTPAPGTDVPSGVLAGAAAFPSIAEHIPGGRKLLEDSGDVGRRFGGY